VEDLKAYIESGVLELYAVGELSPAERHEVEQMLNKYPELRAELIDIEKALETYAAKHAIEPEGNLRERVIGALDIQEPSVRSLPVATKQNNFYKYAFAASVALLLLSAVALINLRSQLSNSQQQIAVLQTANQKFSSRVNYMDRQLGDIRQTLEIYQNPGDYKLVELKGLPKTPNAKMMVAFNADKQVVMIDAASLQMPATDNEHQYQLWALVDGTPVDLGVFDAKADSGMVKMKPVSNAQAFAVTLEPKGGSKAPTLDQMVAMGSI
jgi:anti-sigma-K factor RskA